MLTNINGSSLEALIVNQLMEQNGFEQGDQPERCLYETALIML